MSNGTIGGISMDELMEAAMTNLNKSDNSQPEKCEPVKKDDGLNGGSFGSNEKNEPEKKFQTENKDSGEKILKNTVSGNEPKVYSTNLSTEFKNEYTRIMDLIDNNRTVEAIKSAEKLVDENISVPNAWLALGCAYRSENRNDDALKAFHQAIAYDNTYSLAYSEMSTLLCDIENYESVKEYAEKALIYNKEDVNAKLSMCVATQHLDGLDPAIELVKEYIEKSEDVERLQNLLGSFYVEKALEFAVEIPDRPFFDPMAIAMDKIKNLNNDVEYDTYIAFISEEDITDAKKYLDMATPLLTLDDEIFNTYKEVSGELYDLCEKCLTLYPLSDERFIKVYPYLLGVFHFLIAFCTWGIGLPLMIAPFITGKANLVPGYVLHYMIYYNSKSPLDYKERALREKIEKHPMLNSFIVDHEKTRPENEIMKAVQLLEGASLLKMFGSVLFDMHTFLLKCRLYYYKHFIQIKIQQKKEREALNSVATPVIDEPKSEK